MAEHTPLAAPRLSALQAAWLHEIGLDRNLLARFQPVRGAGAAASGAGRAAAVSASAPVSKPAAASGSAPGKRPPAPAVEPASPETRGGPLTAKGGFVGAAALLRGAPIQAPARNEAPRDWTALQASVAACQACDLGQSRSRAVFGAGAEQAAQWMVIGEAPGDHDDRTGLPFQGTAGTLLNAMLAAAGVPPDSQVYFTNLVKCRPLGNRTPRPAEVESCLPYLRRQIALLEPRRILALGRLAAQALLDSDGDLEQLRGVVHEFRCETGRRIPLVATYHPASLLSRPQYKAGAWRDLNLARAAGAVSESPDHAPAGRSDRPATDRRDDSGSSSV